MAVSQIVMKFQSLWCCDACYSGYEEPQLFIIGSNTYEVIQEVLLQ